MRINILSKNALSRIIALLSLFVLATALVGAYKFAEEDGSTKHSNMVLCSYYPLDKNLMRGSYYTPFGLYRYMHDEQACLKTGGKVEDVQKRTWGFRTYLYPKHLRNISPGERTSPGRLRGIPSRFVTRYGYYGTEQEQLKAPIGWQSKGYVWEDRNVYQGVYTEPGLLKYKKELSNRFGPYKAPSTTAGYGLEPNGYSVDLA